MLPSLGRGLRRDPAPCQTSFPSSTPTEPAIRAKPRSIGRSVKDEGPGLRRPLARWRQFLRRVLGDRPSDKTSGASPSVRDCASYDASRKSKPSQRDAGHFDPPFGFFDQQSRSCGRQLVVTTEAALDYLLPHRFNDVVERQPVQHGVERAGFELDLALGKQFHTLDNRVPVLLALGQRRQHQERRFSHLFSHVSSIYSSAAYNRHFSR